MQKVVIYLALTICFISASLLPLVLSVFLMLVSNEAFYAYILVSVFSVAVILQTVGIIYILRRRKTGLHLFSSVLIFSILGHLSDAILTSMENGWDNSWLNSLDTLIIPVIAIWLFYFSDAKEFFEFSGGKDHESMQ